MKPAWWMRQHLRTMRWFQYQNGKQLAVWRDTNAPADEAEALAGEEAPATGTERIPNER